MAQQTLQTIVAIGGRIDNSFGMIGNALIGMGSQIDMISQKLIELGKDSIEKYVNYDDMMREVKAVGEFTDAEIKSLDKINARIAKTTTYSNIQAAEAEVIMGQYGMTIKEIQTLLPDTLELAMAGGISLKHSVDYLYSSLKSLGLGMEYADTFTDQMTKTAAIGATDIDTLGDSLTRLGSGAQMFTGGSVEIFAILSAMSQFGKDQRGSQAGTWIRNFMLSLVAPTGDIDAMTDAMYELGYTADEIDEWAGSRQSGAAAQAVQSLVDAGLRIYDESGNLLPALDIIRSLRNAVKGSDEYAGDLTELTAAYTQAGGDMETFLATTDGMTDNGLYAVLRTIFNRRGITTAMNLIKITDEEWQQIVGDIINSDGFAESMATTMQGGLGGAQRKLEAAYTKFRTHLGEILEPTVTAGTVFLKDFVISLDEVDDGKLEALVAGLTPLAAAGPALMGAGMAFRLIGYALGSAGGVVLGSLAIVSAVMALEKLKEADMAANFGTMDMDMESLGAYVLGLGDAFAQSYSEVNEFSGALDGAVTAYETASSTFASNLLTDMLTGVKLTEKDIASLQSTGEQMYTALIEGAAYSTATSMSYWKMIFGGEGVAEYDEAYQDVIALLEQGYDDWTVTAEGMERDFELKLNLYWENDGIIDQDEFADLMAQVDKANAMIAELENENAEIERRRLLQKMQTASFDDLLAYSNMAAEQRDADLATENERYETEYFRQQIRWENAIASGRELYGGPATEERMLAVLSALETEHNQFVLANSASYDDTLIRGWDGVLGQSDLADAYQSAEDMAALYLRGLISPEAAGTLLRSQYGQNYLAGETGFGSQTSDKAQLGEMLVRQIISLGGYDALANKINYYEGIGDVETASTLRSLQAMEQIVNGFTQSAIMGGDYMFGWFDGDIVAAHQMGDYSKNIPQYGAYAGGMDAETARALIEVVDKNGNIAKLWETIGSLNETGTGLDVMAAHQDLLGGQKEVFSDIISALGKVYDFEAALTDMGGADKYGDFGDVAAARWLLYGEGRGNAEQYLLEQPEPMTVPVELDTSGVGGALGAMQGMLDASPGRWQVFVETFGTGSVGKSSGKLIMSTAALNRYADGGRSELPAIFGEDGAEWAIPEEHSDRTAELLNAAREGAGFTWPELIDRNGGLNANANRTPSQLIYSPTIIVKDAKGVAEALADDKERLDKWYREKQLRDDVEVYV